MFPRPAHGFRGDEMAASTRNRAAFRELSPYQGAGEPAEHPTLILSHFCRPPFVAFGTVKVGSSKTVRLAIENPQPEAAEVRVDKFPSSKGFSLENGEQVLQPKERHFLLIRWTPLEEGSIRELITFVVNGVAKHQAVLLGRAEQTKKAKNNLWDAIKKKHGMAGMTSTRSRKRELNVRNTKGFTTFEKMGYGGLSRMRSPLQSCENLATTGENVSSPKDSIDSTENKRPVSSVGCIRKGHCDATHTPDSLKRSNTHTVFCTADYESLEEIVSLSSVQKDLNYDEIEKMIIQRQDNRVLFPIKENHVACNSDSMNLLTTFPVLCTTTNCKSGHEVTHTNNQQPLNFDLETICIQNSDNELESINCSTEKSDERNINCIYSPIDTSDSHPELCTSLSQRRILSPDSFVNNSFIPDDIEQAHIAPILSPDEFVKDNFLVLQSVAPQQLHESLLSTPSLFSSLESSLSTNSSPVQMNKINTSFEKLDPMTSRLTYCIKPKQKHSFPHSEILSDLNSERPKRLPVLSATITKNRGVTKERSEISKEPKCRRHLGSVLTEPESILPQFTKPVDAFNDLPIIDLVSNGTMVQEGEILSSSSVSLTTLNRKRKSGECIEDTNFDTRSSKYMEFAKISKTVVKPCMEEKKPNNAKRLYSTGNLSSGGKRTHGKKLAFKSPSLKHQRVNSSSSKTEFSSMTPVQTVSSSQTLSTFANYKKSKHFVAVPQTRLTFVKSKTAIPRHPMPFAAKNVFFDERWKEKQERGFTWWLNFILTPDDYTVKTDSVRVNAATLILGAENHHKTSVPKAPTKEEMSLRAYTARCRLNKLRRTACRLFTSELMVKAIKRLEIEIEAKRLLVREDRHLWKDIGERQKVLNWLLSYNPLWLRIGLETVYGELISLESNSDVMGLAMFILNRVLWNPDIAAEYRHPTVPHLYRDGHEVALSKFTLKKLLLLVFFLDHAKKSRLIDHDPCLFCKDAVFKTSKDILLAFSRDFLSGEGDLSRHLSFLGLPVSHVQTPLDEFDFAVTNLAIDLQCGVRLVRVVELLMQNWSLSKKLRVPVVSRLQKKHNVELALQALKEWGVQLEDEHGTAIDSRDIVDRHREKTLALLWKIAFTFQVNILFNMEQLKEEIDFLKHAWNRRKNMTTVLSCSNPLSTMKRDSNSNFSPENYSENVRLLMEWINAVCLFYSAKVENFTVSFSDGRILCYLIHHYHPCYLPLDAICQRTTLTIECTQTGTVALNSSSDSDNSLDTWPGIFDQSITASALYKELLENERKNFLLVNAAVADLGGIPAMIHHSDMSNTIPDEKVVITYLSFLCARLLELHKETRAAYVIQTAWKKYRHKAEQELQRREDKAARIIQRAAVALLARLRFKKYVSAAVVIQKYWRCYVTKKRFWTFKLKKLENIQRAAATVIQTCWRRYSSRKYYQHLKWYTVRMQARIRTKNAVASYKQLQWATITIQKYFHSWLLVKNHLQEYKRIKSSALVIQHAFRRWKKHRTEQQTKAAKVLQAVFRKWQARKWTTKHTAALLIQSWYKMHKERQQYLQVRQSVIKIQACFRCLKAKHAYKMKKKHVVTLQKYYRAYRQGKDEREKYLLKYAAIISLQAAFRGMKAREHCRQIRAACVIQSFWRMRRERIRFLRLRQSAVILQAHIRKWQQLRRLMENKKAACVIQAQCRAHVASKQARLAYKRRYSAVLVIQSAYRLMQSRKAACQLRSVLKIQASYRAYIARKRFLSLKGTVIKIQALVKMKKVRKWYCDLRNTTLYVQRQYRARKCMRQHKREYRRLKEACVKLQAAIRGFLVRKQIKLWEKSAAIIQFHYRMRKERENYLSMYSAAIVVQKNYGYKEVVCERLKFLNIKRSTICLQAAYRGYRTRKALKHQHQAAVKIQAMFRAHVAKKKYVAIRQACNRIQSWYKNCKINHTVRANFLRMKRAAVTIQTAYRNWVAYRLRQKHTAAVLIQSAFRKYRAQKQFRTVKNAVQTIQQHYKACGAGRRARQKYLKLYSSVLKLQAVWRASVVRKQVQKRHQAAVVIQSYYRMHVNWTKFKTMRFAAIVIQKHCRAYHIGKEQHSLYLKTKAAAVILQAAYRGMKVRKERCRLNKAATTIQAAYKAFMFRKKYVVLRAATVAIQQWYRLVRQAKRQRLEFLCLRNAAIKTQAIYRGVMTRRQIQHMHLAAMSIQSVFRMYQQHVKYQAIRMAATVIQKNYRAYYQGKKEREKYLKLKKSTVLMQAVYRGRKVRRQLQILNDAATLIQSCYRMYKQYRYFKDLMTVTKWVQLRYRACKETSIQVHRYKIMKSSAICIQSAFRGMKIRRHLKTMHLAASVVQRRVKSYLERKKYLSLKKASILVQQRYKLKILAVHQRQEYVCLRKATITVQATYRGFKVRRQIEQMHRAATVIQALYRMHKARHSFRTMKLASVVVQRYYRAYRKGKCERENDLKLRSSAIVVQAAYRGLKARQHLKKMHIAASKIQAVYLMRRQSSYYRRVQWATKVIQQRYRANKLRDVEVYRYCTIKKAVTCIQLAFRSMRKRERLQSMHRAASVIQRQFKTFSERKRFLAVRTAAVTTQRQYRALIVTKKQCQKYFSVCKAAVRIQAGYRGMKVRREFKRMHLAATTIQSAVRMHKVQIHYKSMRTATCIIQNYYKSYILGKREREKFLTLRKSVVVIQSAFRGMKVRQNLKTMHVAAIVIQSQYRMYKQLAFYRRACWAIKTIQQRYRAKNAGDAELQQYIRIKTATLCIQAAFRAMKTRQATKTTLAAQRIQATLQMYVQRKCFCKKKAATLVIQSAYRGYRVRAQYKAIQVSATGIQRWYRACHGTHLQRVQYLDQRQAAITIQAAFRGMVARRLAKQKRAARKIQSFLHMAVYRRNLIKLKAAAVILQSYYRMHRNKRQYLMYRKSALILQQHFRSYLATKHQREVFQQAQRSNIIVQTVITRFIEDKQLSNMKASTIIIQMKAERIFRFTSAAYHHLCALKIQRKYRVHLALKHAHKHINMVIYIQRWFRNKLQLKKFHQDCQKIIKLQRAVRFWMNRRNTAASIIQRAARQFLLHKHQEKIKNGIIKIQALWRGYSWRKSKSTPKMRALQQRLEQANKDSHEENKLCNRTAIAIGYLLKYKHLSYILAALKHLEVATRLSSVCCENMAKSGAILTIFILIRNCNRSIPCMEIIRYAIQVLLNLSKYEKTTKAVYDVENSVDTLLDLMQIYKEKAGDKVAYKGGSIFTKSCCLLAILALDSRRALEIRSIPKAIDRICSICKLTARKHKMDAERTFSKQMNTFVNGNFFVQVVSRIKPDWVLTKSNMKEVVDPLSAIQMVMDTLNIAY
ncbi:LOW QUALITY PROTEIN: abnormal spindle-like microcephaly-associated protein [Rhinatrema bivittatum]|uniref:LOW QUALITY PROTEIN: abnormal spindle-like microcephaly-associated protein n=1 Tax=Rhinatrema bivittatum TaxID=194408 RepID=UPI00112CBFBA|nr:LOW QUALITY PROTEIN: abnormal spindle-like microcephaly-associated protein [Rhinatrema bivittatum]